MSIWGFLLAVLESPNVVVKSRFFLHISVRTRQYTITKNVADSTYDRYVYKIEVLVNSDFVYRAQVGHEIISIAGIIRGRVFLEDIR